MSADPSRGAGGALGRECEPSGFLVARSPLLPFDELVRWSEGISRSGDATAHAAARDEAVARLRRAFARPELAEALLFASPELAARLPAWLSGVGDSKLERTLARYFQRAASRETPFGAFAGISLGAIGAADALRLLGRDRYRRRARLGMGFLLRTLSELANAPELAETVRYEATSTLYRACGRIRYASLGLEPGHSPSTTYPVVDVEPTPHLEAALARATRGATRAELAAAVVSPNVQPDEARAFIDALIENRILVPAWLPPMSGPEPFAATVAALREANAHRAATELEARCSLVAELEALPLGRGVPVLEQLVGGEAASSAAPLAERDQLAQRIQADLLKPVDELSLGPESVSALLAAAELLARTAGAERDLRLEEFRRRFEARYEGQRVPLVQALDADLGVGYDRFESDPRSELIDDLPRTPKSDRARAFDAYDAARLRFLTRALRRGGRAHELDREALGWFPERKLERLPESFAVVARLGRPASGRVSVVAPSVLSPSAVAMLARFCHSEPELAERVRAHVALEQARAGDALLVDVVHLPNGHVANILLRPVLRSHEITYHGKSGAPPDRQLPLEDLFVGLEGERVVLYSQRLGRRLSIRITNAHNFDGWWNLPIYRFFGALQHQDHGFLSGGWSWGALEDAPFLPRVVHGDVVLSRARWLVEKRQLDALRADDARGFRAMQALRAELELPRWVSFGDGDQRLPVDLDNPLSVEVLLHELHDRSRCELEELLPTPAELALEGPEGSFAVEVVVPFLRKVSDGSSPRARPEPPLLALSRSARSRPPGSDWLYLKLYAGRSHWPELLQVVHAAALEHAPEPSPWFFLPFSDPEPHLRVRFHGERGRLLGELYPHLERALAPSFDAGVVQRVVLDTYERELERYGGPRGMELSERLFWADSEAARRMLAVCADDDELGWQLALLGIDRLYADFGLDLAARARLSRELCDDYGAEQGATTVTWRKVGDKYRRHAERLRVWLFGDAPPDDARIAEAFAALAERSHRVREIRAGLERAAAAGELGQQRDTLLRSYLHLHAIRLLGDSARLYELVLHDFLRRSYTSELARRRTTRGEPA